MYSVTACRGNLRQAQIAGQYSFCCSTQQLDCTALPISRIVSAAGVRLALQPSDGVSLFSCHMSETQRLCELLDHACIQTLSRTERSKMAWAAQPVTISSSKHFWLFSLKPAVQAGRCFRPEPATSCWVSPPHQQQIMTLTCVCNRTHTRSNPNNNSFQAEELCTLIGFCNVHQQVKDRMLSDAI